MSYTGGVSLAAATALPMTSGAMYLWSRNVNYNLAVAFAAVSVLSLMYSASVIVRYYKNSKGNN